ncbi:MAG: helix-turn-helix transcriptional regulator [Deltaproteobacteria bacterium]|nr:helix-turn-helix transcriptional regulator [Deltaproteobacteria bacterium]
MDSLPPLDAATVLFAERGPAQVSVKDIAAHAGVNHGLVHRHFGSKEALLRAVMERLVRRIEAALPSEDDQLVEAIDHAFHGTREQGAYFRILAHALLAGEDPTTMQDRFPVAARLVRIAKREGLDDPKRMVSAMLSAGLGWLLFEPWIRASTGYRAKKPPFVRH